MKVVIYFSIVFAIFFAASYFRLDPDFGWHLASGDLIQRSGIAHADPFTYTAFQAQWINHEWANDVIVSKLFEAGGYRFLALVFGLLWTIAIFSASRKPHGFVVLLGSLAILPYAGIRPMVWSLLFFSLMERIMARKRFSHNLLLPLTFLIWANFHGGFVLGLAILFFSMFSKSKTIPLYIFPLSFFATLINPYGADLYIEIHRTVFDSALRLHLFEWMPFIFNAYSLFYMSVLLALFFVVRKKFPTEIPFLPTTLFLISFTSSRHMPFFVSASLRYFERYLEQFQKLIPKKLSSSKRMSFLFLKGIAIIVLIYAIVGALLPRNREEMYPSEAVGYLQSNPCPGNVFNFYNYGGYLLWKLPGKKVYIDGRMPSWPWRNKTYLYRYYTIATSSTFRKEEFEKYTISCVIIPAKNIEGNSIEKLFLKQKNIVEHFGEKELKDEGFIKVVGGKTSALYIKADKFRERE